MLSFLFLKRTDSQGWFRNLVTVFAVTLASATLFSVLSVSEAIPRSLDRNAFHHLVYSSDFELTSSDQLCTECIVIRPDHKQINNLDLDHFFIAKTSQQPLLPGLSRYPESGEVLVTAELNKLIQKDPKVKALFDGQKITETDLSQITPFRDSLAAFSLLSEDLLRSKDLSKLNIAVFTPAQLANSAKNHIILLTLIMNTFMTVGGLGLIFPLLILIVSATRIGMIQRQQRYAALSLIGASKRQINRILLLESLVSSVAGILIGLFIYFLVKTFILPEINIFGAYLHASLIYVSLPTFGFVIALILGLIAIVNWWAMRKVKTSPLGVVKDQKSRRRPSFLRLFPLIAAFVILQFLASKTDMLTSSNSTIYLYLLLGSFVSLMIGLLLSGSFITFLFNLLLSKLARGPVATMSSKRLKVHAKVAFSSVSGVILALFVGSFFITTLESTKATYYAKNPQAKISFSQKSNFYRGHGLSLMYYEGSSDLNFLDHVSDFNQLDPQVLLVRDYRHKEGRPSGILMSCSEIAKFTTKSCPEKIQTPQVLVDYVFIYEYEAQPEFNPAPITESEIQNGQTRIVEKRYLFKDQQTRDLAEVIARREIAKIYRTTGDRHYLMIFPKNFDYTKQFEDTYQGAVSLVYLGTILTIIIGGFSLAVATVGGFFERRKSFANLRLMGVSISMLYKTIFLESLIPLILVSVLAIGIGITSAWLITRAILFQATNDFILAYPDFSYFAVVIGSITLSLVIILSILPLLKAITEHSENRSE